MQPVQRLVIITSGLILLVSAQPHGFDDEGEISVPRSPKIQGPPVVTLDYSNGTMENLLCQIEGTPTPTVIWLRNGHGIDKNDIYNTTYDARDGQAVLSFTDSAYNDSKSIEGNFTCIAGNFLGKVQKAFIIVRVVAVQTTTLLSTISTEGNTEYSHNSTLKSTKDYESTTKPYSNETTSHVDPTATATHNVHNNHNPMAVSSSGKTYLTTPFRKKYTYKPTTISVSKLSTEANAIH